MARRTTVMLVAFLIGTTVSVSFRPLWSQTQGITLILRQPPPNQLNVPDLWRLNINNPTGTQLRTYLRGTVTEEKAGLILTGVSGAFDLRTGVTLFTSANASLLEPVQISYSGNPRYRDVIERTGSFPTGHYTVCLELYPAGGAAGRLLAQDCINQDVELASPPQLLSPANNDTVSMTLPVFSWAPPVPLPRGMQVTYSLRIVELLGRQSAIGAIQSNPAWYEQQNIGAPVLQYSPGARGFQAGRRYAWMVSAFGSNFLIGQSEVWEFVYSPLILPAIITQKKKGLDVLEELLRSCNDEVKE